MNSISFTNENVKVSREMGTWVPDLVSVIIPCYNGARFLREAIESVLRYWHNYWSERLARKVPYQIRSWHLIAAMRNMLVLMRYHPRVFVRYAYQLSKKLFSPKIS